LEYKCNEYSFPDSQKERKQKTINFLMVFRQ
jgi:hypothetical protein